MRTRKDPKSKRTDGKDKGTDQDWNQERVFYEMHNERMLTKNPPYKPEWTLQVETCTLKMIGFHRQKISPPYTTVFIGQPGEHWTDWEQESEDRKEDPKIGITT